MTKIASRGSCLNFRCNATWKNLHVHFWKNLYNIFRTSHCDSHWFCWCVVGPPLMLFCACWSSHWQCGRFYVCQTCVIRVKWQRQALLIPKRCGSLTPLVGTLLNLKQSLGSGWTRRTGEEGDHWRIWKQYKPFTSHHCDKETHSRWALLYIIWQTLSSAFVKIDFVGKQVLFKICRLSCKAVIKLWNIFWYHVVLMDTTALLMRFWHDQCQELSQT